MTCLAAGLVLLSASSCSRSTSPLRTDQLTPCASADGPNDALCGTLRVFEDRQSQSGRRIDLAIVVLPALAESPQPDPLFFLAGGPGQGAARMATAVDTVFSRVRRDRDLVLVDQRGTGRSNPLNCRPGNDSLRTELSDDAVVANLRKCLAAYDADVRLYTTSIAMDDLDDVRRHLGYERINLYGGSYGTRAALVYLRQHGSSVRSVVLDGVAPTTCDCRCSPRATPGRRSRRCSKTATATSAAAQPSRRSRIAPPH